MHIAITGAATGIGAATVAQLKAAGHRITAFDLVEPEGIDSSTDHWVQVDMSDMAAIDQAATLAVGPFDALINNAGVPPLVDNSGGGNARKVLSINVLGLIRLTRALESKLTPNGAIVSTASRAGQAWRENIDEVRALLAIDDPSGLAPFIEQNEIDATRAYRLSKEAVIVWNMSQTRHWIAAGLRGNTVSPAAVETSILKDFKTAFGAPVDAALAQAGRAGSAKEIAAVIAFLAAPESHWIKGQDIVVDGGMTALALSDVLKL